MWWSHWIALSALFGSPRPAANRKPSPYHQKSLFQNFFVDFLLLSSLLPTSESVSSPEFPREKGENGVHSTASLLLDTLCRSPHRITCHGHGRRDTQVAQNSRPGYSLHDTAETFFLAAELHKKSTPRTDIAAWKVPSVLFANQSRPPLRFVPSASQLSRSRHSKQDRHSFVASRVIPPTMSDRTLNFPQGEADKLEPYLRPTAAASASVSGTPFVTLTFATSLDSALSLAPGTRTALSGPQSKAMTHYLRSRHDAICVGVGTAIADDPGLNCRLEGLDMSRQPRPVVIDPRLRWTFTRESKVLQLVRAGEGLAPFIVTSQRSPPEAQQALLEEHGGKYIFLDYSEAGHGRFQWSDVLRAVAAEGLQSIMIEGGGQIINSLLEAGSSHLVNSVILTIAPTWLGQGGVVVSPPRRLDSHGTPVPAARLSDTAWLPLGEDVVLCGRLA